MQLTYLIGITDKRRETGLSRHAIYRLVHGGRMPAVRIGRNLRFPTTRPIPDKASFHPDEAAEILGMDRRSVYRYLESGHLEGFRATGADLGTRVTRESIIDLVCSGAMHDGQPQEEPVQGD